MTHPRAAAALLGAGLLCFGPARAQSPPPPCGDAVVVARGDTLSRIAERCDVSEAALLRDNPNLSGSDDLRAGQELRLRRGGPDLGTRLDRALGSVGTIASRAGSALNDLAGEVGASVDDLLARNPDLHSRVRQLGDRLGLAGLDAGAASASVSPTSGPPGTLITVTALGLPATAPVVIGAGRRRSAYEVLYQARTSGTGTLQATVPVPSWAAGTLVFVVASPERGLAVRSAPFEVTGPARP